MRAANTVPLNRSNLGMRLWAWKLHARECTCQWWSGSLGFNEVSMFHPKQLCKLLRQFGCMGFCLVHGFLIGCFFMPRIHPFHVYAFVFSGPFGLIKKPPSDIFFLFLLPSLSSSTLAEAILSSSSSSYHPHHHHH